MPEFATLPGRRMPPCFGGCAEWVQLRIMTDVQHSLATYVSDMLALEEHVCVPFRTQRDDTDVQSFPQASALVQRILTLSETHIQALQSALDALGGHPAHPVKSAFTNIEGWAASAIDKMRKTKVAKALRDDYTALALCTASYTMLLTTAHAFKNEQLAQLALRHLHDYTQAIVDIGDALPLVVVRDLNQTGMPADESIAPRAQSEARAAWRSGETATTTTGTIESDATINRGQSGTYPTI
jgi:ferritin-like metal-binding protein YciE